MQNLQKVNRSHQIPIYPNFHKLEETRYNAQIFIKYLQHFLTQLYFYKGKSLSTKGMGTLANQAHHKAQGILNAHRATIKETGSKSNIPQVKFKATPAKITKSKHTTFDYWITLTSQFKNKIKIPARSHKALNKALKQGWKLSEYCELNEYKGNWYCRIFVSKMVIKALPKTKSIGMDVGIKHSVTRSDGYMGQNLSLLIKAEKQKQSSRNKNHHKKKSIKTPIKMILDREAQSAVRRSKRTGCNLVIENPKRLANLKSGKLHGWARSYFGNRVQILAKEESVWVEKVNPWGTSTTCLICGHRDGKSRRSQSEFVCTACGNTAHADINSAGYIALKGQEKVNRKYFTDKNPARDILYAV